MKTEPSDRVYRELQRHLDRQPIGFPAVSDGSDVRLLKHIFSPEEAELAMSLEAGWRSVEEIEGEYRGRQGKLEDVGKVLEEMLRKGGVEAKEEGGKRYYCSAPLVVGMYELQLDRLNPEFIRDFRRYTGSAAYGLSFLSTELPQMRTIPVERSIEARYDVADFDTVGRLLDDSEGPFVIVECICRKKSEMEGRMCRVTQDKETCLALGKIAGTVLLGGKGREISREEARGILNRNQKKGLILQPSNTRKAEFICSCCGCCCGMLNIHKRLPKPLDYWSTTYIATVVEGVECTACGACLKRCQVNALSWSGDGKSVEVDGDRCLGCGHCVSVCAAGALDLVKRENAAVPPRDREELHRILAENKAGTWKKTQIAGKLVLDTLIKNRKRARKSVNHG